MFFVVSVFIVTLFEGVTFFILQKISDNDVAQKRYKAYRRPLLFICDIAPVKKFWDIVFVRDDRTIRQTSIFLHASN